VVELDMSVEDAAKLIISAGLVYPAGTEGAPILTTPVAGPVAGAEDGAREGGGGPGGVSGRAAE
jgi:hypothetical protein